MKWLIFLFPIIVASENADPHTYRDYVYNRKTNAYYKLHIEEKNKDDSMYTCRMEGSALMLPTSAEDIAQVHGMLKKYPDIGSLVWIEDVEETQESEGELPLDSTEDPKSSFKICHAITRYQGEIEYYLCSELHPFVCKVNAKDVPYDDQCNVNAQGYDYYSSIGSCYKALQESYTWDLAYNECQQEGAHLVVINSEAEHRVVWDVIKVAVVSAIVQAHSNVFAGFRAERTDNGGLREFKTIFNETLDQAGYNEWSDGEPNNYGGTEYCGAICYDTGKFNDVNCNLSHAFICEKEIPRK